MQEILRHFIPQDDRKSKLILKGGEIYLMDDQNNPGGTAPTEPAAEPTPATPQPQTETPAGQNCVTCGQAASAGSCVACGQGEVNCTCQPAGSDQGEPSAPVGEPNPGAPAV